MRPSPASTVVALRRFTAAAFDAASALASGVAVAVALACLALPATAASLDEADRLAAHRLATDTPWRGEAPRASPRRATHALGVQTLLVEVDERKGERRDGTTRRARVYQYDHGAARARALLVDVAPGAATPVLEQRALDGTHWPLNAAERDWVRTRLAATPWLPAALAAERAARGLVPLAPGAALDALRVKASVHEPLDASAACTRRRCALVSLFGIDGTVSAIEPVVHFADGAVSALAGERP